jgi:16S rRNA (cytosine967-C5)-methyltransferase
MRLLYGTGIAIRQFMPMLTLSHRMDKMLQPAPIRKSRKVKRPNPDAKDGRKTALFILDRLQQGPATLDAVMAAIDGKLHAMPSRDRALTQTIVYGVLRWQRRLDAYIAHFSETKKRRIDPIVLNLLRIGIFQILYLDRVPVSAAVNTTVQLTKTHAPYWVVGYVNGLLRQVARKHADLTLPIDQRDPIETLGIQKSFPTWMIQRWVNRFGAKETVALCDAMNQIPAITVRVNTLKNSRREVMKFLESYVESVQVTPYSPLGLKLDGLRQAVDHIPAFKRGAFQVQDEAAQLATLIMDPKPGESILDACAGLGGKTSHIAQAIQNQGLVIAADRLAGKLRLLQKEMQRLGITCVRPMTIDWSRSDTELNLPRFDRILLDAPCTGMGVIRRNPDAKWRAEKSNFRRYQQRQLDILNRMAPLLKPKGIVIYTVCSFEPEENEFVINGFLKNHSEFVKEDIGPCDPDEIVKLGSQKGLLRTFPHRHAMDGFFFARLRKIS